MRLSPRVGMKNKIIIFLLGVSFIFLFLFFSTILEKAGWFLAPEEIGEAEVVILGNSGLIEKDALIIGFVQGVAVLPGISRSGATISAALFLGMERGSARSFSFLLSIPAILGALLLSLNSPLTQGSVSEKMIFLGAFTAAVVGFFALKALLRAVKGGRLHYFAPYCWAVGAIALAIMAF